MGVNKITKGFGIKLVDTLDKERKIIFADNIATIISNKFNYIEYGYIFEKMMAAQLYIGIIPEGLTRAIYVYEEDTLIINEEESLTNISPELLYECIHTIQDIRDKKGNIKQLRAMYFYRFQGLCNGIK